MRRKCPSVTKKRGVMAYLVQWKGPRLSWLGQALCILHGRKGPLASKIEEEGSGLPVCNEQGHGYLVCKRGLRSLFTFGKEVSSGLGSQD